MAREAARQRRATAGFAVRNYLFVQRERHTMRAASVRDSNRQEK